MDDDKNNNTLRATSHGLDFWLLNPSPGILTDTMKGIRNGIKWSSAINSDYTYNLDFGLWDNVAYKNGVFYPRCYKVVFHDEIVDSSQEIYLSLKNNVRIKIPAKPVNFRIYDLLSNQEMSFGFRENLAPGKTGVPYGYFSAKDEIWFMEKLPNDSIITTFYILNNSTTDSADFINYYSRRLSSGDTLYLFTESQYTSQNRFRFAVTPARIDTSSARAAMDNIKVVPNPYVVTVGWEPKNPYTDGRGSRAIRFIHLPSICTIRIYSIDGTLIQTINHQAGLADGSAEWDLLTRDNMDISYGIYIYHVDAPGIGEKVGKIIIIK